MQKLVKRTNGPIFDMHGKLCLEKDNNFVRFLKVT